MDLLTLHGFLAPSERAVRVPEKQVDLVETGVVESVAWCGREVE